MPFTIIRDDITRLPVDAVVNAANTALLMGGGVCGAIFKAAGPAAMQAACRDLAPIQTGEAVITPGFALPAKYVIHTAGPIYQDGHHGEADLLRDAYRNSLHLAVENDCRSIAFPLISSGIYGYPKEQALQIATDTVRDFLADHDLEVYLVVFDRDALAVSEELLGEVAQFVDEHYVDHALRHEWRRGRGWNRDYESADLVSGVAALPAPPPILGSAAIAAQIGVDATAAPADLADAIGNLDEPFGQTLLRLIDSKGQTDVEVYKKANLDRRLFSKIRSGKGYMPSKKTALALAVALELNVRETNDLLRRAGFTLSSSQLGDVIIEYFITNRKFDIFEINEVLFAYDQPLLGG